MRKLLKTYFDYRRNIYNRGLAIWKLQYQQYCRQKQKHRPSWYSVRNYLVKHKTSYDRLYPSGILKVTIHQLGYAWNNYFNSQMRNDRPKFKTKKRSKQTVSFELEGTHNFIKNSKLMLPASQKNKQVNYPIRLAEQPRFVGKIKFITVSLIGNHYYVAMTIDTKQIVTLPKTNRKIGIDVNVGHFDASYQKVKQLTTLPKSLFKLNEQAIFYQRVLAHKRLTNPRHFLSRKYYRTKTKLDKIYQKIINIQDDLLHKYTKMLVTNFDYIGIETLDVRQMKVDHYLAKSIQRSLFGKFTVLLKQKAALYGKQVIQVAPDYPSTQLCSSCGYRRTKLSPGGKMTLNGDNIHKDHQNYYCPNCLTKIDRDINAANNIEHEMTRLLALN